MLTRDNNMLGGFMVHCGGLIIHTIIEELIDNKGLVCYNDGDGIR